MYCIHKENKHPNTYNYINVKKEKINRDPYFLTIKSENLLHLRKTFLTKIIGKEIVQVQDERNSHIGLVISNPHNKHNYSSCVQFETGRGLFTILSYF